MIDDFEAGAGQIPAREGRGGFWYDYDDGSRGTRSREEVAAPAAGGGSRALHFAASGFHSWGAGFGVNLHPDSTFSRACPYDASPYAGLRLRARGHGRLRILLADTASTPVDMGGECTKPQQSCFDRPGVWFDLDEQWQTYEFPFCAFAPEGWGGSREGVDPSRLVGLQFRASKRETVEVWLDDIGFYRTELAATGARCAAQRCPLEAAPKTARLEPRFTDAPLDDELTLHLLEQPTKSCGPLTRRYLSYVPQRLGPRATAPVAIVLHGSGGNAEAARTFQARDRFDALAARDGFIVVYGNAAPGAQTSGNPLLANTGAWRQAFYADGEVDDVQYLELVLADLQARGVIAGGNPVVLAGLSNGGGMVLEAARRIPHRLRGIAALMPFDGIEPEPVPDLTRTPLRRVLFAYATDDPAMPPRYHELMALQPARWAAAMGLPPAVIAAPVRSELPDRVAEGRDYRGSNPIALATRSGHVTQLDMGGADGTTRVRVLDMHRSGHFWPHPQGDTADWVIEDYGFRNQDFDAADMVWEFLRPATE